MCATQPFTSDSWVIGGTDRLHGSGVSTPVGLTQLDSQHQTKFPIPDPSSPPSNDSIRPQPSISFWTGQVKCWSAEQAPAQVRLL